MTSQTRAPEVAARQARRLCGRPLDWIEIVAGGADEQRIARPVPVSALPGNGCRMQRIRLAGHAALETAGGELAFASAR